MCVWAPCACLVHQRPEGGTRSLELPCGCWEWISLWKSTSALQLWDISPAPYRMFFICLIFFKLTFSLDIWKCLTILIYLMIYQILIYPHSWLNDPILDYNTQLKKLELHIFCGSELRSSFTLLIELSSQLQYVRYPIVDLWTIIVLKNNNRKIKEAGI